MGDFKVGSFTIRPLWGEVEVDGETASGVRSSGLGAIFEVRMHFAVGCHSIDKIRHRMRERVFVANDMSWRPPGTEIRM